MKILNKLNLDAFQRVENRLEAMLEKDNIDLKVISDLSVILNDFKAIQEFWESNKSKDIAKAFIIYHYARNTGIIIKRIIEVFEKAKELNRNPDVVLDTLDILPALLEAYEDLTSIDIDNLESKDFFKSFSQKSRTLRDFAECINFLPSLEETLAAMDKTLFKKNLANFLDIAYEELHLEELENENQ